MKKDDARRDAGVASGSLPTEGAALVAVSALMEERRRYEGWIAALDARRATTADHVFERVHLDYAMRLEAVIVQLATHTDDLRREMHSLTSRLGALTAEQQRAEDERAEAELRALVGELSAEDGERSAAASDATLAELTARRADVEQELARTRELLDSTVRPTASAPAVVEHRASRPVQAMEEPAAAALASTESDLPMELPPSVIAAEQQLLDIEDRPARQSMPVKAPTDPDAAKPKTAVPPASPRRSSGFDELAFLSSVVDTPAGAFDPAPVDQPDEAARRDTFARRAQEDAIVPLSEGGTPLDSPVIEKEGDPLFTSPGGGSSIISHDSSTDGVKSLKCGDCGAMNRPTEWYCERCGAELASL
jgi:HPt (histidine-containing phosphotransfer) domain-containing protein